jgi:hypothetical protein
MSLETFGDLNYLAVVVAAVVYFAIGALWYSVLFSKPWVRESGVDPEAGGNPVPLYAASFVTAFLAATALAFLARSAGAETLAEGLLLGVLVSVGFVIASLGITQAYEGRTATLQLINVGYPVVALVIASVIVTVWT